MWGTIGSWIEHGISAAESYFVGSQQMEYQLEMEKARAEREIEIEKAKTKKLLYFGLGFLGIAILVRMLKIM